MFGSLIASSSIGVELPQKTNPGPLASRITFFAPVGLLFFFFVVAIFAAAQKREIHPLNYLFFGCAFFAATNRLQDLRNRNRFSHSPLIDGDELKARTTGRTARTDELRESSHRPRKNFGEHCNPSVALPVEWTHVSSIFGINRRARTIVF